MEHAYTRHCSDCAKFEVSDKKGVGFCTNVPALRVKVCSDADICESYCPRNDKHEPSASAQLADYLGCTDVSGLRMKDFLENAALNGKYGKIDAGPAVSHPAHYAGDGIECIDAMEAAFGREAVYWFCVCNAFKYVWRNGRKPGSDYDLEKASWYLERASSIGWRVRDGDRDGVSKSAVLEILDPTDGENAERIAESLGYKDEALKDVAVDGALAALEWANGKVWEL